MLITCVFISHKEDMMEKAPMLKNNRNQAVRLPKAVALPDAVERVDVTPEGRAWEEWFDGPGVSDDFMAIRHQPSEQIRA